MVFSDVEDELFLEYTKKEKNLLKETILYCFQEIDSRLN